MGVTPLTRDSRTIRNGTVLELFVEELRIFKKSQRLQSLIEV